MFKKIIGVLSLILLILSCQNTSNTVRLRGTTDLGDGNKILHVVADFNNQPKILDTILVKENSFSLNLEIESPDIHFLQINGQKESFPFIAENGTIIIDLHKDSLGLSKAIGTISNDDFMRYKSETSILSQNLKDEDEGSKRQEIQDQIKSYELDFIKTSNNSFISVLILERFVANKGITIPEATEIFNDFNDVIKNSISGKKVSKLLAPSSKPEVGLTAPMFEGPNPEGVLISLEDRLGKITIIDFWASWCRPCRVENPSLVKLYQKYQYSGLSIVGVSLDKGKSQWLQAIVDDGLIWDHVSNLKFWNDPIAKLYQVSAIPATFVLDENGVIIAQNLRGIQLERKVEELLGSL